MTPRRALEVTAREAAAVATLLEDADLSAPVPWCPGWTAAALVRHLGGIHRWARAAVLTGPGEVDPGPADDGALPAWFAQGAAQLLAVLRSEDPDRPCWGFGPSPRTVGFWLRRQAHETAVHRWDLERALGRTPAPLPEALDGLHEVATVFLPRQLRAGRCEATGALLDLHPDGAEHVRLDLGAPPGAAPLVLAGPAEELLLRVWGRLPADDLPEDVQAVLRLALVP